MFEEAKQLYAISLILLVTGTCSFQMNMVLNIPRSPTFKIPESPTFTELISKLAVSALKRRLAYCKKVDCIVNAEPTDLLRGKVGPVTVTGKGWRSPMGLTCRAIEAVVDDCSLDMTSIIQKQKLHLNFPAKGNAMVAFDAKDFGSFLTHDLLEAPSHRFNGSTHKIKFLDEGVSIQPLDGSVVFNVEFLQGIWNCALRRASDGGAEIQVSFVEGSQTLSKDDISLLETGLTCSMSSFFSELIINLDGTFVNFKDMMVTCKGKFPSVILALNIIVHRFPSRSISF